MNIKNKFRHRSASRLACIQILYNSIILNKEINQIIEGYNLSFMDDLKKLFEIDGFIIDGHEQADDEDIREVNLSAFRKTWA